MRAYDPAEFASLLASNRLEQPVDLTIQGLVKGDPGDGSVLLFSLTPACGQWLPIPLAMITTVRHLRDARCRGHQHPFVAVTLAAPAKEEAAATVFMSLFAHARALAAAAARGKTPDVKQPRMQHGCEVVTFDDVPYVCCPPAADAGTGSWDCFIMV